MENPYFSSALLVLSAPSDTTKCIYYAGGATGMGGINTFQDQGLSRKDNAAPAYMLTNLVDVTTTFKVVDIHLYMMELQFSFYARINVGTLPEQLAR
jgi:hypothetical protein